MATAPGATRRADAGRAGLPLQGAPSPKQSTGTRWFRSTARHMGVPAGIFIVEPEVDELEQAVAEGYTFIVYSVDFRFLDTGARRGIAAMRELQR